MSGTLRSFLSGLAAAVLGLTLACGGGGDDAPPPAPPAVPTVTSFSPTSGDVGTIVTVSGTNLAGATAVRFNGTAASFTPVSATQLTATVPSGATTGTVSVTTSGGTATSSSTFTVTAPTGTEVLLNGGFEAATLGQYWSTGGLLYGTSGGVTPHGGARQAWIGGYGASGGDTLNTEVGLPANATAATLRFWMTITTAETGTTAVDTCTVRAYDAATGGLLGNLRTLSNLDKTTGWVQFSLDLLPYKGKVVMLDWTSSENASLQTSWFLDDVSVLVAAPATTPTVLGVTPTSGYAGEGSLDVLSAFAYDATGITVNGVACTGFTLVNGGRCRGTLAGTATTGPVGVQTPRGSATGGTVTVQYRIPTLSRFNPTSGPVGTTVVLEGQYLSGVTALNLNGAAVPSGSYTVNSDTQITVTIPSGATSGVFQAVSSGGSGSTASSFTVSGATTADYWIDRLHLNQANQNVAGDVPAVAGRDAILRVFLRANQSGLTVPTVQVTLTPSGGSAETLTALATPTSVPTTPDLGSWGTSLNFAIPAAKVAPGVSFSATVNTGGLPESDATNNSASLSPTVRTPTRFRTTIIPVTQGGATGNVTVGNLDSWVTRLTAMFPVETGVDVALGSTWTYSGAALQSNGTGWSPLLTALEQKRVSEGSNRYYYGALNVSYSSGVAGLGYVPSSGSTSGRSAIGWDKTGYGDGGNYYDVYTHETGHNLGRSHSPCGGAGGPDVNYPYAGGGIGTWGLDVAAATASPATGALKDPSSYKDIMGYCSPNWISDYVFKGILTHRLATPQTVAQGPIPEQPCLVISAVETERGFELGPVLEVPTVPTAASPLEGFRLEGLDAKGGGLFSIPVEAAPVGCGPFAGRRHIVAALPVTPELAGRLARLRLVEGGAERAVREAVPAAPAFRVVEAPKARRVGGGIELTWDATVHPAAWVRDPATGEIRATLTGGRALLPEVESHWELRLSDGLRTTTQAVPQPQ